MRELTSKPSIEPTATGDVFERSPPPGSMMKTVIKPRKAWTSLGLHELWAYRDLLWVLIQRDVKLRYRQTALGIIWVILQPLVAALIFAIIFGRISHIPSDGLPSLLFIFAGLVAWNYFAAAVQRGSNSLVLNSQLITKVYFPRLLIPLAHTLAVFIDFGVMLLILIFLMCAYQVTPSWQVAALPVFLLLLLCTATGVTLWLAALSVKYRDFMYAVPFLIQVWMYASPIIYPASLIPEKWRALYSLNPIVGLIEGFRWSVLGTGMLTLKISTITIVTSAVLVVSGAVFFRRVERSFADVI